MTSQEILKKAGLKITGPRKTILGFLIKEHGPFSVDEIYQKLKNYKITELLKPLDLVTVYRCMSIFETSQLVKRCDFGDGVARYEFYAGKTHHHHHVICNQCRKTEVLESCALPEFEKKVKAMGYQNIYHSLEFFGICSKCQKTQ